MPYRFALPGLMFFAVTALALAQDQPPAPPPAQPAPPANTWRHMNDQPPAQQTPGQPQNPEPVDRTAQPADPNQPPQGQQAPPPAYGVPAQLTIRPNTYFNIRINQILNSDKNHVGDTFAATLMQPILVDGIVVAPRGQAVYGRITEAEKAHDGKDSRLAVEINSVTLADGSQATVTAHLVTMHGGNMPGRVATGTVVNTGAAGAPGVMLTHNHATVIDPSYMLTFALNGPVTINTANSQAYHYVGPDDYYQEGSARPAQRSGVMVAPPPYPYYYPYGYPYPYWGPGIGIGVGFGWGWGGRWGRRW